MRSLRGCAIWIFTAACAFGQKAETTYYQARLTASQASGVANLAMHAIRDNTGQLTSGTLDFAVAYKFPGSVTVTRVNLLSGSAIALTIPLNLPLDFTGAKGFTQQAQVALPSTLLAAIQQNPSQFTVQIKNSSSDLSGTLAPALQAHAMAMLQGASDGLALVTATAALNGSGTIVSATLGFVWQLSNGASLTGASLTDAEGNTLLDAGSPANAKQFLSMPDLNDPDAYNAVLRIFDRPDATLQFNTSQGTVSGVLQAVDSQSFAATLLPSLEAPPVTFSGSAASLFTVSTLRDATGAATAAAFTFDVNYRLPMPDTFTGLYLQQGAIGSNGLALVSAGYTSANPFRSDPSGNGNVTTVTMVNDAAGLAAIETLLHAPTQVYVNLHTGSYPAGALRSQLGVSGATPHPAAVINAVNDLSVMAVAPGAIVSIYGSDLASDTIDLTGYQGSVLSPVYQGMSVTVGGHPAPFTYISPTQINAQIPFESPVGMRPLVVSVNGQESAPFMVNVQPFAPGIFFDATSGIVVHNADFTVVRPEKPAHAGEILVVYCTGLGATSPPLSTGWRVPFPPLFYTAQPSVTIGGLFAPVVYSIASPQYVGLYQVAVKMPEGLTGNQPLLMSIQGVRSNTVTIATAP